MTRTHTPGPWTRRHGQHVYAGASASEAGRLLFAAAPNSGTREELDESFANARLIAAAPEMLVALKLALPVLESHNPHRYSGDCVDAVRFAIAKAEGV